MADPHAERYRVRREECSCHSSRLVLFLLLHRKRQTSPRIKGRHPKVSCCSPRWQSFIYEAYSILPGHLREAAFQPMLHQFRSAAARFAEPTANIGNVVNVLCCNSVFWALPVSTQWHIHSECLSSNTNKKACSNSTFCREQKKSRFPEKFSEKRFKTPWVKVQVHRICLTRQLASFCHASKNGRKKARKSLKLLGFSRRYLFWFY